MGQNVTHIYYHKKIALSIQKLKKVFFKFCGLMELAFGEPLSPYLCRGNIAFSKFLGTTCGG
jgi:hypothetical protein